jgi:toxin ParE1/3/4
MSAELHDDADAELTEASVYYELHREGYAARFLAAFRSARDFVVDHPRSGRPERYGVRSWPISGFPYDIVYVSRGAEILIIAVAHHRRRPGYWRSRLDKG